MGVRGKTVGEVWLSKGNNWRLLGDRYPKVDWTCILEKWTECFVKICEFTGGNRPTRQWCIIWRGWYGKFIMRERQIGQFVKRCIQVHVYCIILVKLMGFSWLSVLQCSHNLCCDIPDSTWAYQCSCLPAYDNVWYTKKSFIWYEAWYNSLCWEVGRL